MPVVYVWLPIAVWIISQTLKFGIRLCAGGVPPDLQDWLWVYVWAGGTPSTHTAILTSVLYLVWHEFRFSAISTFCTAVTMLWLYDMAADRKREELLELYLAQTGHPVLGRMVSDGYLLDIAGHAWSEIVWGAVLGLLLGFLATKWLRPSMRTEEEE